jgi:hypothetical protein
MARFILLSNALHHAREYSKIAPRMYEAGIDMDGQIHLVVKYPAATQRM